MHKTWNGIEVEKFIPARTSSYCSSVIAPCLCVVKVPFMGSLLIRKIKLVRLPSSNDRHSHKFRIILLLQILQEGDFIYEKAFAYSFQLMLIPSLLFYWRIFPQIKIVEWKFAFCTWREEWVKIKKKMVHLLSCWMKIVIMLF